MSDSESVMFREVERAIEAGEFELGPGEEDFLKNVARYLKNGWELSPKMDAWFERIWKKATGHQ